MSNYQLDEDQKKASDFAIFCKYAILAMDVGTGKTLASLDAAIRSGCKNILVVSPVSLVFQWRNEIKKFFPEKTSILLDHPTKFHEPWGVDIVITTYQFLSKAGELFNWADIVIGDEIHMIKNMDSGRGDSFHRMIFEYSIPRVILLSGTIIENKILELHSPLAIMEYNPRIIESKFLAEYPTYVEFANKFSNLVEEVKYYHGKRVVERNWHGVRNKEELHKILKKHMIFIKDKLNIPYQDHSVFVGEAEDPILLEEYEKFLQNEDSYKLNTSNKIKSAMAKTKLTASYVKRLVADGKPVIVFTDHIEVANTLAQLLGVTAITGSSNAATRTKAVTLFNEGDKDIIVATLGSLSTGHNMQQSCSDVVFNDYPWKPSILTQARGRIKRKNQLKKCHFHFMLGSPQDDLIMKKIIAKEEIIKQVKEIEI